MDDRLTKAIQFARDALDETEDDPGMVMSPDGWSERYASASMLRQLLAILEPATWCPPHYYQGHTGTVRGQAVLECEICSDSYIGTWEDEGKHDRPDNPVIPCGRCKGEGWSDRASAPCKVCGGSGTKPRDDAKAAEVMAEHKRVQERFRARQQT